MNASTMSWVFGSPVSCQIVGQRLGSVMAQQNRGYQIMPDSDGGPQPFRSLAPPIPNYPLAQRDLSFIFLTP
jgi:hypothetical protein